MGSVGILNIGCGDTKLVFDNSNPAECIRAARIVTDMLRRGYALLVEVEQNGKKIFHRVREFREETQEYIIADFDPIVAQEADRYERNAQSSTEARVEPSDDENAETRPSEPPAPEPQPKSRKSRGRIIKASSSRAVAVPRTAGG